MQVLNCISQRSDGGEISDSKFWGLGMGRKLGSNDSGRKCRTVLQLRIILPSVLQVEFITVLPSLLSYYLALKAIVRVRMLIHLAILYQGSARKSKESKACCSDLHTQNKRSRV